MFAELFRKFEDQMLLAFKLDALPAAIAVAVSGGSDSMALCLLAKKWCDKNAIKLVALTVDHGLRPEAGIEAQNVGAWLGVHGIEHHVLKWLGPYPDAGIQQSARAARYALLIEQCEALEIEHILLGHQLEDQLETTLMRLSKGSAVQGLAAMHVLSKRGPVTLVRPLLDIQREGLREFLDDCEQSWVDDPSNENPKYTRTKLGDLLRQMTNLPGSGIEAIALASKRLQRADAALECVTSELLSSLVNISPYGFVSFPLDFYKSAPEEITLRFLERVFAYVRGSEKRPMLSSLENLYFTICQNEELKAATLSGCQLKKYNNCWIVCREPGRTGMPIMTFEAGPTIVWDDRFIVVDHAAQNESGEQFSLTIRRLGDDGWRILTKSKDFDLKFSAPNIVKKNLPSIWLEDKLVAVPLFSYSSSMLGIAKGRFEVVFSPKSNLI